MIEKNIIIEEKGENRKKIHKNKSRKNIKI